MNSKVCSDWLPSYIKATGPVLEIFKMAGYFPDSPPTYIYIYTYEGWNFNSGNYLFTTDTK